MKKSQTKPLRFLGTEPETCDYSQARFVVIPVPYEATTTYGKGTKHGPAAILAASQHVEEFDQELGLETYTRSPIHTLRPLAVAGLEERVAGLILDNKIPVVLGGEHSITPVAVKACARHYKDLSVLQLDAHADLRNSYLGRKDNHACVMRRVLEVCPAVQAGIRSLSKEGHEFAGKTGQLKKIHWAEHLEAVEQITSQLSSNVYITIDVDAFDPSIMPATGTPEPGGLLWYEALDILKAVCRAKNVVGFDVMELAPLKGQPAPDFMVAKLIYKLMGYLTLKN
jgi:agmatinase